MKTVKERRSVRTYDGVLLSQEDQDRLMKFAEELENPYGIKIEYAFLRPDEHGLKSPVLSGETLYMVPKVKKVPHFEEALGYSMEAIVLYAQSLGIGTVWIGGTMNRDAFERAIDLKADEIMPCVTPVGYPAKKMSLKETMMRKGVKADSRLELGEIVQDRNLMPYAPEQGSALADALEMVRWAPSAVNKQPWRVIVDDNRIHFYEKPDKGYVNAATGDLQRIDIGIAMYHFVYGMQKKGAAPAFSSEDSGITVPPEWQYVATYTL